MTETLKQNLSKYTQGGFQNCIVRPKLMYAYTYLYLCIHKQGRIDPLVFCAKKPWSWPMHRLIYGIVYLALCE